MIQGSHLPKSSLTSLRFIAAFLVLGFHFFSFEGAFSFLNVIFHRGHLGVDFFFILSGFVLGLRYERDFSNNHFDVRKFFALRMLRLAPAYYLSLLLALVMLIKSVPKTEFLLDQWNLLIFILANITFTQSFFPASTLIENWNVPSWSLSVEFFFYLSFPLISARVIKSQYNFLLILTCFVACITFVTLDSYLPETISFLNSPTKVIWINSCLFRLPEFLLGNLLAVNFLKGRGEDKKTYGLLLSLILVFLVFCAPLPNLMIRSGNPFVLLSFSLLIYFAAMNDSGKGIFNHPWLVLLGEASYVLYICQSPLKLLFQQVYTKILGGAHTTGLLYSSYLAACLICTSLMIYKYFELPLVKYWRKKLT